MTSSPIGSMTADEVRQKFNLKYDEQTAARMNAKQLGMNRKGTKTRLQNDAGHIWYEDNGEQKYLGQVNNVRGSINNMEGEGQHEGADKNKFIGDGHVSTNALLQQVRGDNSSNGFNTINDVAGTMRKLIADSPEVEEEEAVDTSKPASQTLTKAQSYTQAYDDFRKSGGAVDQMAGDLGARDEFLDSYKLNIQRRMEPGVAHAVGNDDLPEMQEQQTKQKRSKIAADIVGKGAGFDQV